jgi:ferric-dicitrate binding protein FerR (iron transport regulator)
VKGHFRTRGRNSSASARGTKWTMSDSCGGTLTIVRSGTVVVRDFTLRKNKTLRAGQRYLAHAPRRRNR